MSTSELVPHLVIDGAADAIAWYGEAFGASEVMRIPVPDGSKLVHAEISVLGHKVYLCDPFGGGRDPNAIGGSPVTLHLQVPDVDALFTRAIAAGATETMAVMDAFWGDRYGSLVDPFGHHWSIATPTRTPSEEEMQSAMRQWFG